MNVLLDTCAVLALARGDLPNDASAALKTATEAWVSTVTAWEVAIKVEAGKLELTGTPFSWFQKILKRYDLQEIPLDCRIACAAAMLPPIHKDPFDRVIVAVAGANDLTILTSDQNIGRYSGIQTCW